MNVNAGCSTEIKFPAIRNKNNVINEDIRSIKLFLFIDFDMNYANFYLY